jgi:eukaryotic-like serine/threonine-protein kinase
MTGPLKYRSGIFYYCNDPVYRATWVNKNYFDLLGREDRIIPVATPMVPSSTFPSQDPLLGTPYVVPAVASPQYPTEEGVMVGSPRTVAPEQIRFQPVDARTDIYAVGLLLYTMIAGRPPFAYARDLLKMLNAHLMEAPRAPSIYAPQLVPAMLDRLILKALAKRPEHRFQSAEEMAAELAPFASMAFSPLPPRGLAPLAARFPVLVEQRRAQEAVWFAPPASASPVVTLPPNLFSLPEPPLAKEGAELQTFAVLTLASTVFFSFLAAVFLRLLEAR